MATTTAARPDLDPLDFLALDALLDDEERAIRDTVRQFVRERVLPEVGDWFEQGILPREVIQELAKLGLFGMHLEGYGLPGASATAYGLTCLELEAGDSGVRSAVSVQGSLAMFAIWRWGSEEQKERWLPAMHRGEAIGCFGLTEPDAGSDPGTMRTHARRDGDDWILNGAKMWITNGTIADVAVVWARTDDGEIRGFLVEKGMPGFSAPEIHKKISLRASITSELVLQDVRVPTDAMLPGASTLRGPLSCLNEARFGIVFGAVGAARACFEEALSYAKERIVLARRAASRPHEGRRHAPPGARQPREDGERPRRARGLPLRAHDPRGQRGHARVPGDPPHEQPRIGADLRRHARGAHARRRTGPDGRERLRPGLTTRGRDRALSRRAETGPDSVGARLHGPPPPRPG